MTQCKMNWENPYSMPRFPTISKNGMVATSQPTAAQTGITILNQGGNAVDAAIATAAALTVVEPTCNGIGGDAFAIVWFKNKMYGLNGSGPAPKSISLEAITKLGYDKIPSRGWLGVTVPGVPSAWASLAKRFGKLPLIETLQPAIKLAREGYAVPVNLAYLWQKSFLEYSTLKGEEFKSWFETFTINNKAPTCGQVWKSEAHTKTLESIGLSEGKSFYQGDLADQIDAYSKKYGGYLHKDDLFDYQAKWVEPIGVDYRNFKVWEIPPNGQGIAVLMALNILNQLDADQLSIHNTIEAVKLAMSDAAFYVTDPTKMSHSVEDLLSLKYAKQRKNEIKESAQIPKHGIIEKGGTVYLATSDSEGNMVSYIQSNYEEFGSALVVPNTGIALQNRGANFSLDPNHLNALEPGKRSYHTIIPGFLTKDNKPIGPFGVMGGFNQPQAHVQVLSNLIDFNLNPQAALDAPRWRHLKENQILVEPHFPLHSQKELVKKGHIVTTSMNTEMFGRGQIIWKDEINNTYIGGTESRTDSSIAVL